MMKKKRTQIRLPDLEDDRAQLMQVSRRGLKDLMEDSAPLDNLANLAQALKQAKEKKS